MSAEHPITIDLSKREGESTADYLQRIAGRWRPAGGSGGSEPYVVEASLEPLGPEPAFVREGREAALAKLRPVKKEKKRGR